MSVVHYVQYIHYSMYNNSIPLRLIGNMFVTSFMNVPSPFQMEYASEQEKVLDDEGGWVDTHHYADKDSLGDKISEMNLEDAASSSPGLFDPSKYLFL